MDISVQKLSFEEALTVITHSAHVIPKPLLISIAGGSCSGKTYFAAQLAQAFHNAHGCICTSIIPLDAFFRDRNDPQNPRDQQNKNIFDMPDSFHHDQFIYTVTQVAYGNSIYIPSYDIRSNTRLSDQDVIIQAHPIIIAEGLFAISFLRDKPHCHKICVYVDTHIEICLARRIARDTENYAVT